MLEIFKPKCSDCRFSSFEENRSRGICRRYPPISVACDNSISSVYPRIDKENSCGEFSNTIDTFIKEGDEMFENSEKKRVIGILYADT